MKTKSLLLTTTVVLIAAGGYFVFSQLRSDCDGPYPDWKTSDYVLPYPPGRSYEVWQGNCDGGHRVNEGGAFRYCFDFLMPIGTEIAAARGGRVIYVREHYRDGNGGGPVGTDNIVMVDHGDGTYASYAHLTHQGALVEVGDFVAQGQVIALSGNTGMTGGRPHLHFGISLCSSIPCGQRTSIPTTFRNTSPNPKGLQAGEVYEAMASEE